MISSSTKSTVHNNKHHYNHRIAIYCLFLLSILSSTTASRMPPLRDGGSPTMSLERHNSLNSNEDKKKIYTPISTTRGGAIPTDVATTTAQQQTSKVRSVLFPIYGPDVKKFFLLGAIKFFIIMALTLTRDNKDTMIVTTCGAEAIAFLKVRLCICVLCK